MQPNRLERRIQLRVSEDLWNEISLIARKREQSVSSEIRRILVREFMPTKQEERTQSR